MQVNRRGSVMKVLWTVVLSALVSACDAPTDDQIIVTAGPLTSGESVTEDGVLAFAPLAGEGEGENIVTVYDRLNDKEVARVPVCAGPEKGALTPDEVSYMIVCPGADQVQMINTASFEISSSRAAKGVRFATTTGKSPPSRAISNQVVMLGMIHDGHLTSAKYSLEHLRALIRDIKPDYVLTEIPPNRLDAAMMGFRDTGKVTEPRAGVFPEYVDVLFPLSAEMDFEIIGVAAWNTHMNTYRSAQWRALRNDPAMAHAWDEYDQAFEEFGEALEGRDDDPLFIHSDEFDEITRAGFEPYQRYFNAALGPGGWKNINQAHYKLVARALDSHKGEGKTLLIMFGASHKYWFLDELRKREDIVLADTAQIIEDVLLQD